MDSNLVVINHSMLEFIIDFINIIVSILRAKHTSIIRAGKGGIEEKTTIPMNFGAIS